MVEPDSMAALQAENARLIALLESRGIDWWLPTKPAPSVQEPEPSRLSTQAKVALFRRLFRGRTDVHALRWESTASGKSGYSPACANDRFTRKIHVHGDAARSARAGDGPGASRAEVCEKPRIKCGDCGNRLLIPLSDAVIYDHLAGKHTIGVYPLLEDDTCYFLAVDFDEAEWREDARAFMQSCEELGVPAALEISRSGNGAHAWVFFAGRVSARDARRLGTAIISHTCARTRQLKLDSYDRLFPNQDTMPKGGFGNLIALPLQKGPRETRLQRVRRRRAAAVSRISGRSWPPSSPWPRTTSSRPSCGPPVASIRWMSPSSTTRTWRRPGSASRRQPRNWLGRCRSR